MVFLERGHVLEELPEDLQSLASHQRDEEAPHRLTRAHGRSTVKELPPLQLQRHHVHPELKSVQEPVLPRQPRIPQRSIAAEWSDTLHPCLHQLVD